MVMVRVTVSVEAAGSLYMEAHRSFHEIIVEAAVDGRNGIFHFHRQ